MKESHDQPLLQEVQPCGLERHKQEPEDKTNAKGKYNEKKKRKNS